MAKIRGAIIIDKERCKGCSVCVVACPTQVIELNEHVNGKGFNFAFPANHYNCTGCTSCALVCPDMCISVFRMKPERKQAE